MSSALGQLAKNAAITSRACCRAIKKPHRPLTAVVTSATKHELLPGAAAGVILSSAGAAHAETDPALVDSAVSSIVAAVTATGDAVKTGLGLAEQGVAAVAPYAERGGAVVKSTLQAASPVVQAGVRAASEAASSVKPGLERVFTESGVDTKTVSATAEQAATATKPLLDNLVHFLTTSPPEVLAETALGLVAAWYLLPPVLNFGVGLLRGYAGDVSPAAALDALATQSNAVLVDIRSAREKESSGLPDVPNASKLIELEFANVDNKKVRGQLRNLSALEVSITAMQLAAFKRLSKGSAVYLMDRNGGQAKAVAKELAARGFGKVFAIAGGFGAWQRDRLGTKLATSVSAVEVIMPGSYRGGSSSGSAKGGSARTATVALPSGSSRRALPSTTSGSR